MYTGQQFFPNFDDYTHLALIEKRFGKIPLKMVKVCGFSLK